MVKEYHHCLF